MNEITSDLQLTQYATGVGAEIASELADSGLLMQSKDEFGYVVYLPVGDWYESADELAQVRAYGSEHVIYHYKAHALCQNSDTYRGEEFVEDCDMATGSYDEMASRIAYGELRYRILQAVEDCVDDGSHSQDDWEG